MSCPHMGWPHIIWRAVLPACALAGSLSAGPASAQEGDLLSGTMRTINDRGTVRIGYRNGAVPLSFLNKAGQPVGFAVDLCRGIAQDVARRLQRDLVEPDAPAWQKGVRIVFVRVASDERIPKTLSGEIDLECGSTTATDERRKSVAFSPIFFLAGTKIMVPVRDGKAATSYRDLAGKTLAVSTGTTTIAVMRRLAGGVTPPITILETPSTDAAYDALVAGKVDGFASDDILLSGLAATRPGAQPVRIVGEYLSYEPYGIGLRRDDPQFADVVRSSFERMAREDVLTASYGRWFTRPLPTGAPLNLPISPHLAEMYRALGHPD